MWMKNDLLAPSSAKIRASWYLRVSTSAQTNECQRPEVMALSVSRGFDLVDVYEEKASAAKDRPAFERMKQDARAGKFDVLVIWAIDRFGRSMAGNINDVIELDGLGVRVVSVREQWMDTAGPIRDLLVAIFSWVAQQERLRLIERTKAGILAVRAQGKVWGRTSLVMPVDVMERKRAVAKWALKGRGEGYIGLAKELGGCAPMTARKLWQRWGPEIMRVGQLPGPVFFTGGRRSLKRVVDIDLAIEVAVHDMPLSEADIAGIAAAIKMDAERAKAEQLAIFPPKAVGVVTVAEGAVAPSVSLSA